MKRLWLLVLAVPLFFVYTSTADAALCVAGTYQSYVDLGSSGCTIGDKRFYDFLPLAPEDDLSASDIVVVPLPSAFGFAFGFSLTATSGEQSDVLLAYNIQSGGATIIGASVTQTSVVIGNAVAHVGETICPGTTYQACGTGALQLTTFDFAGTGSDQLTDSISFPAVSLLGVTKDFNATSLGETIIDFASLTGVTNAVSQIPEPGTLLLIGSGLAGLGAWSRKKLRK